ncbi:MAG: translation initiation factor IF-3 [Candidatus Latescibacterota bacterium]|nr:MAG: translation initiation factor IF-3 [Candidatus Latescibacterota bacterium]
MRNDKNKQWFRTRINYQIRVPEVRVVGSEGDQLGVMATQEAIRLAEDAGLDLVEVSPTSRPPVCRIMDYGKYKYEKSKRARASKKKQHVIQVKEVKFRPKTEEHDYQFKKKHAEEFLKKMNKVKFTVIFRGRELDHKELGMRMLKRVEEDLEHAGFVERPPQFEGRLMTMMMAPHPARGGSRSKQTERRAAEAGSTTGAEGTETKPDREITQAEPVGEGAETKTSGEGTQTEEGAKSPGAGDSTGSTENSPSDEAQRSTKAGEGE